MSSISLTSIFGIENKTGKGKKKIFEVLSETYSNWMKIRAYRYKSSMNTNEKEKDLVSGISKLNCYFRYHTRRYILAMCHPILPEQINIMYFICYANNIYN